MELDWAWDILGEPVTDIVLPPPRYSAYAQNCRTANLPLYVRTDSAATKAAPAVVEEQTVHLAVPCVGEAGSVDVVVVGAFLTMTVSVIVIAEIDQMVITADHLFETMMMIAMGQAVVVVGEECLVVGHQHT